MATLTPWARVETTAPPRLSREALRERLTAVLICVVFAWVVLPRVMQSVLQPKFRSKVGGVAPEVSGVASLAGQLLALLVVVTCVVILAMVFRDPHELSFATLLVMLLPWIYQVVRNLYVDNEPSVSALLYPFVVVTLWVLRPSTRTFRLLGYLVGAAVILCVFLGVFVPTAGIFRLADGDLVTESKQILPIGILVGYMFHGNNLGQFLALSIPLICAIPRKSHRYALLALTVFALIWTASRSSFLALGMTVLAAAALLLVPRILRSVTAMVVMSVGFVSMCLLPFFTHDPGSFSNRGLIWAQSLQWWHESPWWGLGANWFNKVAQTSGRIASTAFHAHNQFLQFLIMGGIVLVVLVTAQVVFLMLRAAALARHESIVAATWLVALAGTCVMEKSFVYVENAFLFAAVVIPMAVIAFSPPPDGHGARTRARTPSPPRPSYPEGRHVPAPGPAHRMLDDPRLW